MILLCAYFVFMGSTRAGLVQPIYLAINLALFGVFTMLVVFGRWRFSTAVDMPLVGFIGVVLLSSITSIDVRRSFVELWLICIAALLFLVSVNRVGGGLPAELVVKVLLIIGGILMALSWYSVWQWYHHWLLNNPDEWIPSQAYRLPVPNFLAVILNVWLMMALARLLMTRSRVGRVALGVWVVSAVGLLYFTSSRGGWLGTAAGLFCLAVLVARLRGEWLRAVWHRVRGKRIALIGLVALVLIFVLLAAFLLYRQTTQTAHASFFQSRSEFWPAALSAFLRSPLVGSGPFTFVSFYLQHNSVPPRFYFDYAHSIYMDTLGGCGLLGLLALIWLLYRTVITLWRQVTRLQGIDWAVAAGALAALVAFCVHGFFDSVHHTSPTSLWNLAVLLGAAVGIQATQNARGRLLPAGVGVVVVVLTALSLWFILPMRAGVLAGAQGDWQTAVGSFSQAAQRDTRLAIAYQQMGLAYSNLAAQGDAEALSKAVEAFEKTIALDPYWALNHANLGALYLRQGRVDAALSAFGEAIRIAPDAAVYHLNNGVALEVAGSHDKALGAYYRAIALNPDWAEAYFWRSTPVRHEAQQRWRLDHPDVRPSIKALEEEQAQQTNRLKPVVLLADAYLREGLLDKADVLLRKNEDAFTESNADRLEWNWLMAEVLAARGAYQQAVELGDRAVGDMLYDGVYGPGALANGNYAVFAFRTSALNQDFVPQLQGSPFPDRWGKRMQRLAEWYRKLGNEAKATEIENKLIQLIPDNTL